MSAPREIWWVEGGLFVPPENYVVESRGAVKYLRADLPCRECYHMEQDTEDALIWDCDWFGERRDPLRPACMAFKAKP